MYKDVSRHVTSRRLTTLRNGITIHIIVLCKDRVLGIFLLDNKITVMLWMQHDFIGILIQKLIVNKRRTFSFIINNNIIVPTYMPTYCD